MDEVAKIFEKIEVLPDLLVIGLQDMTHSSMRGYLNNLINDHKIKALQKWQNLILGALNAILHARGD